MKFYGPTFKRAAACVAIFLGITLQALPAVAAEPAPQQVLDRVYTYNGSAVLNMAFGNASRPPDFTKLLVSTSAVSTCTLTSTNGLWCLDGQSLKKWANPLAAAPVPTTNILSCTDAALGFDTTLTPSCTGMTVDENGGIWLSGKKKLPNNWPPRPWWIPEATWIALQTWFNPYSVVKVTANVGSCPGGAPKTLAGGAYCAAEMYSGRYLVTQLSPAKIGGKSGVVGIEDFRNILFFADSAPQPVTLSGGWNTGLGFGEVLDDVTTVKQGGQTFVVATTNSGRVLAKNSTSSAPPYQVFHIPADRAPPPPKCSNGQNKFGVRGSPTAAILFVTDRSYCQAMALVPNDNFTGLVHLRWTRQGVNGPITSDLTLSTKDGVGTFPVIGLTVAPGVGIDLADCAPGKTCGIVNDANGDPAAKLSNVTVAAGSTAATVFQVKGLPDCRYALLLDSAKRAICATPGVVINPDGSVATLNLLGQITSIPVYPPYSQVLNVTPLLPLDVTSKFDNTGVPPNGLPPLYISRQYRAQSRNSYVFDAIFIKPAPGVQFSGVLAAEYIVPALEGGAPNSSLGCLPRDEDAPPTRNPSVPLGMPPALANLLKWDVTTAVSETWISVPSVTAAKSFVDALANVGCGSVKGEYGRLSLLPYNMEIAPSSFARTEASQTVPVQIPNDDAVFMRLEDSLVNDLIYVYYELACKNVDNPAGAPLPITFCSPDYFSPPPNHTGTYPLDHLYWIREKLNRCMIGAFDTVGHDSGLQDPNRTYCLTYLDRLDYLQAALVQVGTPPQDKANRVGELRARINVLRHLHKTRVLPSIPDGGYLSAKPLVLPPPPPPPLVIIY